MLNRLKQFFDTRINAPVATPQDREHRLRLATGALVMEMIRADDEVKESELAIARRVLQEKFDLSEDETEELVGLSRDAAHEAVSYYRFTSLINKEFTPAEKIQVVEMLWQVAYADRHLEKYEEHLVRKIAELIYVPHAEFMAAKHRVLKALGRSV
jgi:uncharacterized tellurite resistance protein B-like protein